MTRLLRITAAHTTTLDSSLLTNALRIAAEYFDKAKADAQAAIPLAEAAEAAGQNPFMTANGARHTVKMFEAEAEKYRTAIETLNGPEDDEEEPTLLLVRNPDGGDLYQ